MNSNSSRGISEEVAFVASAVPLFINWGHATPFISWMGWVTFSFGLFLLALQMLRSDHKPEKDLGEGLEALTTAIQEISKGKLDVSLSAVTHPDLQKAAAAIEEMTKNLQAQFQIAISSGASYRNLVESIPVALMKWSARGNLQLVNSPATHLWGYTDVAEMESSTSIYDLFERRDEFKHLLQQAAENETLRDFELTLRRKDGASRLVSGTVAALKDEHGVLYGFAGAFRDINDQRQAEAELVQMEKLESIASFAAGIAQDFNNILCGILPNIEMLKRRMPQNLPPANEVGDPLRFVNSIDKSAQRALTLAKQLVSFSRHRIDHSTVVNVNHILLEELHRLKQSLGSDIKIETDLEADLWSIEADSAQLEEMLIHLAKNAQQSMRGTGVFRVETKNIQVDCCTSVRYRGLQTGTYVQVTVIDSGSGFDTGKLHRIFDPFFSLDELGTSTGLGLSMVLRIVKDHNGHITVDSEPGKGATFNIFFPRTTKEETVSTSPVEQIQRRRAERILVVDDEEIVRDATASLLTELGYEVDSVQDGDEALMRFHRKQSYHAVILDMQMPRLDGGETLIRLRELDPSVKVIITSGFSPQEKIQDLLQTKHCSFLQKPYRLNDIAKVVRSTLDETT